MALFDFIKGLFSSSSAWPNEPVSQESLTPSSQGEELSKSDKELIMVKRVTTADMKALTLLPYEWNCEVRKFITPHGHPFAYIDIIGPNVDIAKSELSKINILISEAQKSNRSIPKNALIPLDKIVFAPHKDRGYTRIMCTPHTFTGKPSKYPASLSFMTDLSSDTNTTHGDLFYGQDGKIKKAVVYCWRRHKSCFMHFTTVNGILALTKVE